MPKDRDEGNKRIEAFFGQIGLGNIDPERISELIEAHERSIETASQVKRRTGKKFKDVLDTEIEESEKNEAPEEEKPE
jgi:hypothetical protein